MRKYLTTCLVWTLLLPGSCSSQPGQAGGDPEESAVSDRAAWDYRTALDTAVFHLIDTQHLRIVHADQLLPFFEKLRRLEQDSLAKVRITHIGDSHLQAGFQTRRTRDFLHRTFGNGGRGIIFPYRVAGTNGPGDLHGYSNVSWESKRNVFPNKPMDIGLAGITIGTDEDDFILELGVACNDSTDNRFDRLLIFHQVEQPAIPFACLESRDPGAMKASRNELRKLYHRVRPGESLWMISRNLGVSVQQLKRWNGLRSNLIHPNKRLIYQKNVRSAIPLDPALLDTLDATVERWEPGGYAEFRFDTPQDTLLIGYHGDQRAELNGMYVENSHPGIVYSMIGVNGAKYEHYNKSADFFDQLAVIESDLIVVSLGTNESLADNYTPELIKKHMASFYQRIRDLHPDAQVLVSTNPNTYSWRRKNPRSATIHKAIVEFCEAERLPYWNMYDLMGGEGSIYRWYKADLAQRDLIHFNADGYRQMGALFYYSLMQAYHNTLQHAPD